MLGRQNMFSLGDLGVQLPTGYEKENRKIKAMYNQGSA